jgi:hypothetical protein
MLDKLHPLVNPIIHLSNQGDGDKRLQMGNLLAPKICLVWLKTEGIFYSSIS